eukprot:TRINITY_DN22764_c0_g1_i1.p1 TRINITY_DN22764_c0_g1~~TRINITY_DN22764_c0_g1_i1.p1  ORF type:complete len:1034 (+),score=287.96 TRINITY_DN22764_c0_g1_i1:56-3157(+)
MAFLPPHEEVQPAPTVELPVFSVADDVPQLPPPPVNGPSTADVPPPATEIDWRPPFSLDTAPFAPGSAQAWKMGAESIMGAVIWLAGVVREERAARHLAEAKAAEVALMAQQALDASGGGSEPAAPAARKDRQDLRWKSWEAKAKVSEELFASKFDALTRDVASRALNQDLDALRDDLATQAAQIRQQVGKETRTALQEGVAKEAADLREQFERINAALNERLDIVDQRLEELSSANQEELQVSKVQTPKSLPRQADSPEEESPASAEASSAAQQEVMDASSSRQSAQGSPDAATEQRTEYPKQMAEATQSSDASAGADELVAVLEALESRVKNLEEKKPGATAAAPKAPKSGKEDVGSAKPVSGSSAAQPVAVVAPILEQPDDSLSPRTEAHFAHLRQELLATLGERMHEMQTALAQVPATAAAVPTAAVATASALPTTAAGPVSEAAPGSQVAPLQDQALLPAPEAKPGGQQASQAPAAAAPPVAQPPPNLQEVTDPLQACEALRSELRTWVKGELQALQSAIEAKPKEAPPMPAMPAMPSGGGDGAMDELREWIEDSIQRVRFDLRQEMQQGLEQLQRLQVDPNPSTVASPLPSVAAEMQDAECEQQPESQVDRELPAQLPGPDAALPQLLGRIAELERLQLSPDKFARLDGRVSMLEKATTGKDIAALKERFASIEHANNAQKNAESNGMLEVQDDLRRLKCRFEYLEKIVPPDVQRAMVFFEPLKDADEESGSRLHSPDAHGPDDVMDNSPGATAVGTTGNVLKRLNLLQVQQDQTIDAARSLAEDGRREVSNLSLALKGVQRDSEIGQARIESLRSDINQLQARLEVVLPQVVSALQGALGKPETKDAIAKRTKGQPAEELLALQSLLTETPVDSARRFVSQDTLRKAMEAVQADMQAWLDKLRQDILAAMVGKADNVELRSLADQLDKQAELSPGRRNLAPLYAGNAAADDAAIVRFPLQQGRCVSCNKQVNLKVDAMGNDPWPSRGAIPLPPSFPPGRTPNNVSLRPLRREASTPTMPADRSLIL